MEQSSWTELFFTQLPICCGRSRGLKSRSEELSCISSSEERTLEDSDGKLLIYNSTRRPLFYLRYESWRNQLDNLKALKDIPKRCDFFIASETTDELVLVCELTKLHNIAALQKDSRGAESISIAERKKEQFIHTLCTLRMCDELWQRVSTSSKRVCLLSCQLRECEEGSLYNRLATAFEAPLRNEAVESARTGMGTVYPFPEVEALNFSYRRVFTRADSTARINLSNIQDETGSQTP